jgi:hypothetical protein
MERAGVASCPTFFKRIAVDKVEELESRIKRLEDAIEYALEMVKLGNPFPALRLKEVLENADES